MNEEDEIPEIIQDKIANHLENLKKFVLLLF